MDFSILGNMDALLLGMKIESLREQKKLTDVCKQLETVSKQIDQDMRNVYDSVMPNVHILDAAYTAKLIIRDIYTNPENYFSKIRVEEDGNIYDEDITTLNKGLAKQAIAKLLTTSVKELITKKIVLAVSTMHANLPGSKEDPVTTLNKAMEPLLNEANSVISNPNIPHEAKIAIVFRLGTQFRMKINSVFGNRALLKTELPGASSVANRYVFFSKNFSDLTSKINPKISSALSLALNASLNINIKFQVSDNITIGKTVHFAHTALKSAGNTILNSPAYSKLIYNTVNSPERAKQSPFSDALRASNHFKIKTGHTKLALVVDKSIIEGSSTLMQLGMTYTTDHASKLNLLMGTKESKYGSGSSGSALKASQQLRTNLDQRRVSSILNTLLRGNPLYGTSSPTLKHLINTHILEAILTGKPKPKKYHATKSRTINNSYIEPTTPKNPAKPNIAQKNVSKPTVRTPHINSTVGERHVGLTSIQTLLNRHLQDVVSANMGNGNARNVLNYRTGRLAASAKVERVSQSKEGMISAFYTYMRNPYGTFSEGGRQQHPRSRDPKTLISKSIKEIAATMMVTRMRAVLV